MNGPQTYIKKPHVAVGLKNWLRGLDLNQRSRLRDYAPDGWRGSASPVIL